MNLVKFILGSFPLLIQQYADYWKDTDFRATLSELSQDLSLPRIQNYDYIVVGGGSAGCIVAARLSEKFSVLLLEAGGDPVPVTYVPYFAWYPETTTGPTFNNIFHSVKQKHSFLGTGGIFKIAAGRMLSGSGSHNADVYNRGSPKDYDNFAQLTRDDSWSYKNVLKYFKKMENYVGKLINEEERTVYYGSGGPINIITAIQPPRLLPNWLKAAQELGYTVSDPNGYQSPSFAPIAYSQRGGIKDSSYVSYIQPIEATRKSLTVLRYSEVELVLIDGNKKAYGVTYHRHGIPQIAHASREVILSAGAISSPLLLIKSGIGDKSILKKAQIPVALHSPGVGQNLHDHSAVSLPFNLRNPSDFIQPKLTDDNIQEELVKFQSSPGVDRSGLFATPFCVGQAFLVSSRTSGQKNWPNIQLLLEQFPDGRSGKDRLAEGQDFTVGVILSRQKSVGEIGFNTTAYLLGLRADTQLALIDHKFYTEQDDVLNLIEGIKIALEVIETTEAFKGLHPQYLDIVPKPCKSVPFRSQSFWECLIKYQTVYSYHPMGTVKMGASDDPSAVLDSKLRVRGVTGLRVVDASIFPEIVNANTNAATMMVAEKAAAEIMENCG